jgi:hypothetical protein
MSKGGKGSRYRGFFSLDAAFAFTLAAILLASFLLLCAQARQSAAESAREESGRLAALRLSSFVISGSEEGGAGICENGYAKAWVVDPARLQGQDFGRLLSASGRSYAGVSLSGEGGWPPPTRQGAKGKELYCAPRLVVAEGKISRMEVCVS